MKKLLSGMALAAVLLTSNALATSDCDNCGDLTIKGKILPFVSVGFGTAPSLVGHNYFKDSSIDLGEHTPCDIKEIVTNVFAISNTANAGIDITLQGNGNLRSEDGYVLPMSYEYTPKGGTTQSVAINGAKLRLTDNIGIVHSQEIVGVFKSIPNPAENQAAGMYKTTLKVCVTAV